MPLRPPSLPDLLSALTVAARLNGYSDTQWASAAGIRKETLSRIRQRSSCDFATIQALAAAVGMTVRTGHLESSGSDGHVPGRWDRVAEGRLLALCASGNMQASAWRQAGPSFFMAGVAVMLASMREMPRKELLALAEALHPGMTQADVFRLWLQRSPLRPARFIPQLRVLRNSVPK